MTKTKQGVKKKIATVAIAGGLVFGGAVAGASSNSFSSFLDNALGSVITKVANFAGYTVSQNKDAKVADVEKHVENEFNGAANKAAGHYVNEVNGANNAINKETADLKAEITSATNKELADGKAAITESVKEARGDSKKDLEDAAKAKAQSLIDAVNNSIPTVPAQ